MPGRPSTPSIPVIAARPLQESKLCLCLPPRAATVTAKTKGPVGDWDQPLSTHSEPADRPGYVPLTRKPLSLRPSPKWPLPQRSPLDPVATLHHLLLAPLRTWTWATCLVMVPGHLDQNFFLSVCALYCVISGKGQHQEKGLLVRMLDTLLAGKRQWDLDLQVTLIPTFNSAVMHRR